MKKWPFDPKNLTKAGFLRFIAHFFRVSSTFPPKINISIEFELLLDQFVQNITFLEQFLTNLGSFWRDFKPMWTVFTHFTTYLRLTQVVFDHSRWYSGPSSTILTIFNLFWGQMPIFSWVTPTFFPQI